MCQDKASGTIHSRLYGTCFLPLIAVSQSNIITVMQNISIRTRQYYEESVISTVRMMGACSPFEFVSASLDTGAADQKHRELINAVHNSVLTPHDLYHTFIICVFPELSELILTSAHSGQSPSERSFSKKSTLPTFWIGGAAGYKLLKGI